LCKNNLGTYNILERYIFAFAGIFKSFFNFIEYSYRQKRFSFASLSLSLSLSLKKKSLGDIKVKSFGIFKNVFRLKME